MTKRKRNRRSPTELEKRAATALMVRARDGAFILPRLEVAHLTPREILREFDRRVIYAHGRAHANGGSMHPSNLWPTRRDEDALETRKDISQIAKGKRVRKREAAHAAVMAARFPASLAYGRVDVRGALSDGLPAAPPPEPEPRKKGRWPTGRKMPSRPFPKGKRAPRRRS
jgi:hypothetical protein